MAFSHFKFSLPRSSHSNQMEYKEVHAYSRNEFAQLISTFIQNHYLQNENKTLPGFYGWSFVGYFIE